MEKRLYDKFLTPIACFHAQQCVEKSFKAVLEKNGSDVPKTHDVVRLYLGRPNTAKSFPQLLNSYHPLLKHCWYRDTMNGFLKKRIDREAVYV